MIVHDDLIQGSEDWFKLRAKMITASCCEEFFVKGRNESGWSSKLLPIAKRIAMHRLNADTLFPDSVDIGFVKAVARGKDLEHDARLCYQSEMFERVIQVGFVESDCGTYGCSPDGLVNSITDGLGGMEIKCLSSSDLHYDAILGNFDDYMHQVQFSMFVTGRLWWDFVSYFPEYKQKKIAIKRFYPDLSLHATYKQKIDEFNLYIESLMKKITA